MNVRQCARGELCACRYLGGERVLRVDFGALEHGDDGDDAAGLAGPDLVLGVVRQVAQRAAGLHLHGRRTDTQNVRWKSKTWASRMPRANPKVGYPENRTRIQNVEVWIDGITAVLSR